MAMKHGIALALAATAIPVALAAVAATAAASTTTRAGGGHAAAVPVSRKPFPAAKTITLTTSDNGRRVHVRRGEDVLVLLQVGPRTDPTTWWHAIGESGRSLTVLPQTAMSVRGTTLGRYRAVARGEATLQTSR